jgi:hypothetical protein
LRSLGQGLLDTLSLVRLHHLAVDGELHVCAHIGKHRPVLVAHDLAGLVGRAVGRAQQLADADQVDAKRPLRRHVGQVLHLQLLALQGDVSQVAVGHRADQRLLKVGFAEVLRRCCRRSQHRKDRQPDERPGALD